jgi:hypothetical protein
MAEMSMRQVCRLITAGFLVITTGACDEPVPSIGQVEADAQSGDVTAPIEPGQTTVTRIIAEYGIRSGFNDAPALFWTSTNILSTAQNGNVAVPFPTQAPFDAKFIIGRDFPLFDGQVVDVQFKAFYRRPNSAAELAFWSQRKSFPAFGRLGGTDKCVLRYRRSTGPLESEPNMPEEQVTNHYFQITVPGGAPVWGSSPFLSGWDHSGQLRQSFQDCSQERPCYGAHARKLSNVGRNKVNVVLNQTAGERYEHLDPGDSVDVHEDIASVSCERYVDPESVINILCRRSPEACASPPSQTDGAIRGEGQACGRVEFGGGVIKNVSCDRNLVCSNGRCVRAPQ